MPQLRGYPNSLLPNTASVHGISIANNYVTTEQSLYLIEAAKGKIQRVHKQDIGRAGEQENESRKA